MTIFVKNKKTFKGNGIYIGRPSILGNPYTHISSGTLAEFVVENRDEAIDKYKEYFSIKMKTDENFKDEINRLVDISKTIDLNLICW